LSTKSGLSFISLSSADLKVGYIGQAAVAIQKAFDEARQKAPCIMYIDEIDASCPVRTGGPNSVIDNKVNAQMLQELDGIKTTDQRPVFVFASTNRPELIDPAILERFTERIEIPLPGAVERHQLLKIFVGKIPLEIPAMPRDDDEIKRRLKDCGYYLSDMCGPDVDKFELIGRTETGDFLLHEFYNEDESEALIKSWEKVMTPKMMLARIADATHGYSGRQLKNLVSKATMKAVERAGFRGIVSLRESDFK
jgi:SpoVK/Ycf46/Vps4 family AAA+-type ATPase